MAAAMMNIMAVKGSEEASAKRVLMALEL
jgi:hypothetical protein